MIRVVELDSGRAYRVRYGPPGVLVEVMWVEERGHWISGKVVDGVTTQDPIPLELETPTGTDDLTPQEHERQIAAGYLERLVGQRP